MTTKLEALAKSVEKNQSIIASLFNEIEKNNLQEKVLHSFSQKLIS